MFEFEFFEIIGGGGGGGDASRSLTAYNYYYELNWTFDKPRLKAAKEGIC